MRVTTNGKPDIDRLAKAFNDFIDTLDQEELEKIDKENQGQKNDKELRAG